MLLKVFGGGDLPSVDRWAALWVACRSIREIWHCSDVPEAGPPLRAALEGAEARVGGTGRPRPAWLRTAARDASAEVRAAASAAFAADAAPFAAAKVAAKAIEDAEDEGEDVSEAVIAAADGSLAAACEVLEGKYGSRIAGVASSLGCGVVGIRHADDRRARGCARPGRAVGLDWSDPLQRAIAERATDEGAVKRLLEA